VGVGHDLIEEGELLGIVREDPAQAPGHLAQDAAGGHHIERRRQLGERRGGAVLDEDLRRRALAGAGVELAVEAREIHRRVAAQLGPHGRLLPAHGAREGGRIDVHQMDLAEMGGQTREVEVVAVAGSQQREPAALPPVTENLGGQPLAVGGVALPEVASLAISLLFCLPGLFVEGGRHRRRIAARNSPLAGQCLRPARCKSSGVPRPPGLPHCKENP
jgi:hypothetical protein